jgi:hypothetical protein
MEHNHSCEILTMTLITSQVASQHEVGTKESKKTDKKAKGKGRKKRAAEREDEDEGENDDEGAGQAECDASDDSEKQRLAKLVPGLLAVMAAAMHSLRPQVSCCSLRGAF